MCGINGIVDYKKSADINVIDRMNDILRHRGPDGSGKYHSVNKVCALGHVRLSIIDVQGSSQPLCNENSTIWITFNGEIYNYKELRKDLLKKGHRFSSDGDTEVLIHLYEEYGHEMLQYLYGMFAFAIWDNNLNELFVARDRLGVKPVFYTVFDGRLIFSSEQKGVLLNKGVVKELNEEGVWNYLSFRSVPAPNTLYKGLSKLLPSHFLVFGESGIRVKQYWTINADRKNYSCLDDNELVLRTESLLEKSIERRLVSDVPLGAFLSGGVDSSLIVAMMSKLMTEPVKTYTVGFKNFAASEAPYAKIVADCYKTEHHELILEEEVFSDYFEKLTILRDAPLSEPADIPLFLLSEMASKDVKILLSGEGSDELFAGYPKYQADHLFKFFKYLPAPILKRVLAFVPSRFRKIEVAIKSLQEQDSLERWVQWFSPFSSAEKRELFLPDSRKFVNPLNSYVSADNNLSLLSSFLFCDCKVWLPDNLLDRGDRMTMGASIEGRVPFLDHDLVDYAFQLPDRVKIRGKHRKWIIKQIALKYLPPEIVNRPKAGFVVPLSQWFRGKLRDYCYDTICSKGSLPEDIISSQNVRIILDNHCSGKKDNYLQIWTLLGLALWYKSCLQRC